MMVSIDLLLAALTAPPEDFHSSLTNSRRLPNRDGPTRNLPANCRTSSTAHEMRTLQFRGSFFFASDVRTGEVFAAANLRSARPFDGLHPRHLPDVLDRSATPDIEKGTPSGWDGVDRISE
jgi:sialic acid synthase SpsE